MSESDGWLKSLVLCPGSNAWIDEPDDGPPKCPHCERMFVRVRDTPFLQVPAHLHECGDGCPIP